MSRAAPVPQSSAVKLPRAVTLLAVISAPSFLALAAAASTQHVFSLDYTLQAWVQGGRHPVLEAPMRALTLPGSGGVLAVLSAIGSTLWTSGLPRAWRWAGTALACVLVLSIAYSRLYLKVHWASDVAGRLTGGLAYLLLVLVALERLRRSAST